MSKLLGSSIFFRMPQALFSLLTLLTTLLYAFPLLLMFIYFFLFLVNSSMHLKCYPFGHKYIQCFQGMRVEDVHVVYLFLL